MNSYSKAEFVKRALFVIFTLTTLSITSAFSQRAYGETGIGVQFGDPTGITLKFYNPGTSVDLLAAWDLDDFFFLNIHLLWDRHLNDEQTVHFFYGPGFFIGLRDRPESDQTDFGFSGSFGLDVIIDKVELFGQLTPRLSFKSTEDFEMGGGVGFRIYFD